MIDFARKLKKYYNYYYYIIAIIIILCYGQSEFEILFEEGCLVLF